MSECESYECYGEVDMDTSTPNLAGGDVLQRSPNGNSLRRNTWLRTSLRRTPNNHETLPNRRWGSFRHTFGGGLELCPTEGHALAPLDLSVCAQMPLTYGRPIMRRDLPHRSVQHRCPDVRDSEVLYSANSPSE
ncbi:hypothetical protein AAG570_013766 [Ranatra chinensis]|uniref:Uncharacterized protein n=1 Tax=Ranatra chinensis TaxID=642074 RepID=A0ABD0YPQ9_9HEMI